MRAFLHGHVGAADAWPSVPIDDWNLPPSRIPGAVRAALQAAVGDEFVRDDRASRLHAMGGASYVDYVRRRMGVVDDAPDVVVAPASHDEVLRVLAVCAEHDVAVVPVGGGTSVVGGLRTSACRIALVIDRLGGLIDLDPVSCLATLGPGITGPRLEPLLAARGFTLGHLPQSWERATMGGYVATRSAGQASTGYGRSDDMVESLLVATPQGTLELGRGPSTAAGPDLRGLLVGSEGAFGVITRIVMRVRRLPTHRYYEGVMLPGFDAGREAFRDVAQGRAQADVMRLSDDAETASTLLMSGPTGTTARVLERYLRVRGVEPGGRALAILGWEGTDDHQLKDRRSATWRALRRHGAVSLGRRAGEAWRRGRFHGPHLRDALMDAGYLVETVETAASWSEFPVLHESVGAALGESLASAPGPYVMSHISHVYETGASLYTTVVAVADRERPIEQWVAAKARVMQAITGSGGTITHHHAVGRDHAPWLPGEIGPLGVSTLAALKRHVDPQGIMNPGVLLEEK